MEVLPRELDALYPAVLAVDGVRHDWRAGHQSVFRGSSNHCW
jgi:hypothetical protein